MATTNGHIVDTDSTPDGVKLKKSQAVAASVNNMPNMPNGTHDEAEEVIEDTSKALQLLRTYEHKDGISIAELMDETKTGGLYADPLIILVPDEAN